MNCEMIIDGKKLQFQEGMTILNVAREAGIDIPTLCYMEEADHRDVCRICVVEVKGADNLLPACSTPAQDGMDVQTESERVIESRRFTIQMLLSTGRHDCITCEANGDCVLQDLAYRYGVEAPEAKPSADIFPTAPEDPFIVRDFSKCVLCGRCVAACNEIQVHDAIPYPFGRRGEDGPALEGWFPIQNPDKCVVCGQCIEACPVGALTEKKALGLARSWETRKVRTTCPYCGVGCQQWLHVKDERIVKVTAVEDAEPNKGRLCVKGRFAYDFIYSEDRLTTPLIREKDGFREASWDEALDFASSKLSDIIKKHGPDSVSGVSCARAFNEDSYNMQKFFRAVIGTNNIDHCART